MAAVQSNDVDMKDQSFENQTNNELLNTSSEFHAASPFKQTPGDNDENANKDTSTPNKPISTPSLPNTQLRNLSISTPDENTENKEMEQIDQGQQVSIINKQNAYITIADNKQLLKISKSNPNKSYLRIQTHDLSKLEHELQTMMKAMITKKQKKLQKKQKNEQIEPKKSDKQEMDEDDDNDDVNQNEKNEDKKEEITNENKLEIIEKALNACYQQLMYYNKLFLNPIQNITQNAKIPANDVMNKQQISANKKEMKLKIQRMKSQIDDRRKKLMHHIQKLNKLRNATKEITINIPQSVKDKMIQNIDYDQENVNHLNEANQANTDKTRQIISMINDNKKKRMIELKQKFDKLKQNELRLKQRAEEIKNEDEKLRKFIELRKRNNMEVGTVPNDDRDTDNDNDTVMSNVNGTENRDHNKNRAISMASSIESTIHGSVSPLMFDKFQHKQINTRLSFINLREVHIKSNLQTGDMEDVDL